MDEYYYYSELLQSRTVPVTSVSEALSNFNRVYVSMYVCMYVLANV